jgi:hypothetical protein
MDERRCEWMGMLENEVENEGREGFGERGTECMG